MRLLNGQLFSRTRQWHGCLDWTIWFSLFRFVMK
jgi:hypothetical protein